MRARVLPQVYVTVRRAWTPRDLSVQGTVSFPLQRATVNGAAVASDWLDDDLDASSSDGFLPFDEDADALPREGSCRRPDTCAWQRARTARALAAWGVAP